MGIVKTSTGNFEIDFPDECPRCHKGIVPVCKVGWKYVNKKNMSLLSVSFLCPSCRDSFFATYSIVDEYVPECCLLECIPAVEEQTRFHEEITKVSPNFCKTYNQAELAEAYNLDEIAGMGYRKALEFLIKDYLTNKKPELKDKIKSQSLSLVINTYVDNDRIRILAERATWLGNDESHFQRKFNDIKTIEAMKKFTNAVLYYIESEYAFDAASAIESMNGKDKKKATNSKQK